MCGRYSLGASHGQIHNMVDYPDINVDEAEWINKDDFSPRYNIAPRSNAPVIRRRGPDDSELVIHTMKWGVVPHWSKHEDLTLNTINARAESLIDSGGMWGSMKGSKRCVVVCDGYFEWLKRGKERLPHFIRRKDNKLMILAGLYDSVILEGATAPLWSFTIVTTDATSSLSWLHDRQPVILSSTANFEAWIDTSQGWHAGLVDVLKPRDGKELECYPVPKEVGRVGTNSPEFIKPVSQRKDGIEALFAKQVAQGEQTPSSSSVPHDTHKAHATFVDDGTSTKRAIDVDMCPHLPSTRSPRKKPTLIPQRFAHMKRPMDTDPEGIPLAKRLKETDPEGVDVQSFNSDLAKSSRGRDNSIMWQHISPKLRSSKVRGGVPTSSSSPKASESSGSDLKITTFFTRSR